MFLISFKVILRIGFRQSSKMVCWVSLNVSVEVSLKNLFSGSFYSWYSLMTWDSFPLRGSLYLYADDDTALFFPGSDDAINCHDMNHDFALLFGYFRTNLLTLNRNFFFGCKTIWSFTSCHWEWGHREGKQFLLRLNAWHSLEFWSPYWDDLW